MQKNNISQGRQNPYVDRPCLLGYSVTSQNTMIFIFGLILETTHSAFYKQFEFYINITQPFLSNDKSVYGSKLK